MTADKPANLTLGFDRLAAVALVSLVRLMPKPPNFAPVGGLGLFAGAHLPLWQAVLVPLAVMLGTDWLLLVLFGWPGFSPVIYASLGVYVLLGRLFLRGSDSPVRIGAVTLLGSAQFFVVTNFAVWWGSDLYPPTLAGLWMCYVLALPFAIGTVAGDLFFSGLLFGVEAASRRGVLREVASEPVQTFKP